MALLQTFDEILQKHNPVNYQKLQEPLLEVKLQDNLRVLEIDDENYISLYKWKNGVRSEHGATLNDQIFEFGAFVSIEYVLRECSTSNDNQEWGKNFFPLVIDGDSAHLLFNNEKGNDYGKIHLYCIPLLYIDEPISYYDSIPSMIETTITGYKEGAIIYDNSKRGLKIDSERLNKISARLNPNSAFWKS